MTIISFLDVNIESGFSIHHRLVNPSRDWLNKMIYILLGCFIPVNLNLVSWSPVFVGDAVNFTFFFPLYPKHVVLGKVRRSRRPLKRIYARSFQKATHITWGCDYFVEKVILSAFLKRKTGVVVAYRGYSAEQSYYLDCTLDVTYCH